MEGPFPKIRIRDLHIRRLTGTKTPDNLARWPIAGTHVS
jgi:hypothetical protein